MISRLRFNKEFNMNDDRYTVFCTLVWYKEEHWQLENIINTVVIDNDTDRPLSKEKVKEMHETICDHVFQNINPEDYS